MNNELYIVDIKEQGERLDHYLKKIKPNLSRSYIQKLIKKQDILLNDKQAKSSSKLNKGDKIKIVIAPPEKLDLKAKKIDLDILYEDEAIIVINKPAGLVVHPVPGNREDTLVNALLAYEDKLSSINGVERPGIVHRLDKDTSGVLVVAKTDTSHRNLIEQFKNREISKVYHTLLKGNLPYKKGKIDAPIGRNPQARKKMAVVKKNSKKAVSYFKVLEYFPDYSYVEVNLETGRTHQIRVHFSYLGYPVLGDEKYSRKKNVIGVKRQMLHAYKLGFKHPLKEKWQEYTAPLPEDFNNLLNYLKEKNKYK